MERLKHSYESWHTYTKVFLKYASEVRSSRVDDTFISPKGNAIAYHLGPYFVVRVMLLDPTKKSSGVAPSVRTACHDIADLVEMNVRTYLN